jgi:hypothetical protein
MKYFMKTDPDPTAAPPSPQMFEEMGAFIEEAFKSGKLVSTGSLDPRVTKIAHRGEVFSITDGPFSEAKEAVVGWAIMDVASKDEAIEWSKRFWSIVGDGSGTIQRIYDPGEFPE